MMVLPHHDRAHTQARMHGLTHVHVHTNARSLTHWLACSLGHRYAHMHVRTHSCARVCTPAHTCAQASHVGARTHMYTHVHACARVHTHVRSLARTHTRRMRSHIQTHTLMYANTMHTRIVAVSGTASRSRTSARHMGLLASSPSCSGALSCSHPAAAASCPPRSKPYCNRASPTATCQSCTHAHTHTRTHARTHARRHACRHASTHAHTYACTHARAHAQVLGDI